MDKILAIATNDATELKGKRTGLWLSELTHFLDVIEAAGYGYDLASPQGGRIPLDEGSAVPAQLKDPVNARYMANPAFKQQLEHSLKCSEVDPAQYVALYLSGGHGTMFDYNLQSTVEQLVRFARSLCQNFPQLQAQGHPKWREVDLTLPALNKGWTYYAPTAREIRSCTAVKAKAARPAKACTSEERILGLCG